MGGTYDVPIGIGINKHDDIGMRTLVRVSKIIQGPNR
jgi:hypothetical protein